MAGTDQSLRYLDCEHVKIAGRRAEGMEVLTREGRFLGHFEGFLVDSDAHQVRYVVVRPKASEPAVSLTPAWGARVDRVDGAIRLGSESPELRPSGTLQTLPFPPAFERDQGDRAFDSAFHAA